MGEARRRGSRQEREANPKGWGWLKKIPDFLFFRIKPGAGKSRPLLTKRERAKIKRAFKRKHGLNRRQCGAIGAGHLPNPGAGL
jgi:hypothetical protein